MVNLKQTLLAAIPRLAQHHILVIGDLILDEYLSGQATRISREAPVPVLELATRRIVPGGAANPAMNIAALGSQVTQVGLVGFDQAGQELQDQLALVKIKTNRIIVDRSRMTTQKTRLMAHGTLRFPQQIARLDRVDRTPPSPQVEQAVIGQIEQAIPTCQAVLISDYRNGFLTDAIIQTIVATATQQQVLVAVDSQGNLDKYRGCNLVRVNHHDTQTYLKQTLQTEADFEVATTTLLEKLRAKAIVIGRGPQGVSLRGEDTPYHHFDPVNVTEVYDVTGAGDTSIAVLTLGIVAGLKLTEAALLANYAAGLVVKKQGNVTPTPAELNRVIESWYAT